MKLSKNQKALYLYLFLAILLAGVVGWTAFLLREKDNPAAGPSAAPSGGSYHNPVFEPVLADPSLVQGDDGYIYAYGTEDDWGDRKGTHLVPVVRSKDLVKWEFVRDAFEAKPSWKGAGGIWAPDVSKHGSQYYMYYSMSTWGDANPGIGVAVADRPEGPFEDKGKLFLSEEIGVGNSIDPMYFKDDDGKAYLIWGSFRGIYGVELSEDGLRTVGAPFKMAGLAFEAPYLVKREGKYYLFLSGGTCCDGKNSTYFVSVGRADSLKGPYLNKDGENINQTIGSMVVMGSNVEKEPEKRFVGPGHNAIFRDAKGTDWLVYHAIDVKEPTLMNGATRRPLMIDPLIWQEGWPAVKDLEPSDEDQPGPVIR